MEAARKAANLYGVESGGSGECLDGRIVDTVFKPCAEIKNRKTWNIYHLCTGKKDKIISKVDIDDGGNDGNESESRGNTNNANEDFSMTETPSWVQCKGVEEFIDHTYTYTIRTIQAADKAIDSAV
ncbi:Uncharacterized protein Fot_14230 [Forsythia ovata]|uniref:Uncharacterized protein n=1 Tax=Forsythia ovata TaxID=205694 RepID=A0ABD1W607_9LAMI